LLQLCSLSALDFVLVSNLDLDSSDLRLAYQIYI
jgi:hypothetical protein